MPKCLQTGYRLEHVNFHLKRAVSTVYKTTKNSSYLQLVSMQYPVAWSEHSIPRYCHGILLYATAPADSEVQNMLHHDWKVIDFISYQSTIKKLAQQLHFFQDICNRNQTYCFHTRLLLLTSIHWSFFNCIELMAPAQTFTFIYIVLSCATNTFTTWMDVSTDICTGQLPHGTFKASC